MEEAMRIEKQYIKHTRETDEKDLTGGCVNMLRAVPGTQ